MMSSQTPISVAVVALTIPLVVTAVICGVARREGRAVPAGSLLRLLVATIIALAAAFFFEHPAIILLGTIVLFVLFAVPVMRALETKALSNLPQESVRSASLEPRRVSSYVPLKFRVPSVVALVLSAAWVVLRAMATDLRPSVMFATSCFAALTFFALYEVWLRDEIFSVRAKDEGDRHRRVMAVFAAQNALSTSFLALAALSLEFPRARSVITVAAGVIGAIGCAFALSTGIQERYLRAWSARR